MLVHLVKLPGQPGRVRLSLGLKLLLKRQKRLKQQEAAPPITELSLRGEEIGLLPKELHGQLRRKLLMSDCVKTQDKLASGPLKRSGTTCRQLSGLRLVVVSLLR
jgi:hypothetical protein